jgi:hypothetical protein
LGPLRRSKGLGKLSLHASPTPRTTHQLQQHGIRKSYPQRAARLARGLPKHKVQRQNPLVGSELPRVRDEATQRVASSWRIQGPIEGTRHPQASYMSPNWEVSLAPLRVGWHRAIRVFPLGITRERRLKPHGPDLVGGGALAPIWSYAEALALADSHP